MGNSDINIEWSKLLPFKKDAIEKLGLKEVEGVYRISKKKADEKFYVVFIGSAVKLEVDLLELILEKDFIKQGGDFSFRYAPVKGEDVRRAIERQMYRQYAPEYNSKEPESTLDVKVNLN